MFEQAVREVKQKKICFVDASITSCHAVAKFLNQKNCTVDYFPSAALALENFAENQYDLLVVDMAAPDKVNTFVRSVRQMVFLNGSILPVIIISATNDVSGYKQSLKGGPSKVVLKPYTDETLQSAMLALTSKLRHFGSDEQVRGTRNAATIKNNIESVTRKQSPTLVSIPEVDIPVLTSMIPLSEPPSDQKEMPSDQLKEQKKENLSEEKTTDRPDSQRAGQVPGFLKAKSGNFKHNVSAVDEDVPPLSMIESIQLELAKNKPQTEKKIQPSNVSHEQFVKPIKTQAEAILDSLDATDRIMASVISQPNEKKLFDKPKKQKIKPLKPLKNEPLRKQKEDKDGKLDFLTAPKNDPVEKNKSLSTKAKSAFLKIVRFMLVVVLLVSGGTFWYLDQLPLEVSLVETLQAPIYSDIQIPGRIQSKRSIIVSARAAGQVMSVNVSESDSVRKGQVLAQLEDKEARNNVKLISARLISSQEDAVAAKKTYERLKGALEFGAVTRRIVEDAEVAWKVLRAKQSEIEQELIVAEVKLDRLQIKAPFSGVVDSVFIQAGQWLFLSENVLTLVDVSQRVVDIPMDVNHSARLNIGQEITLSSEDFNGQPWKEKIVKIGGDIKPKGSLSTVRVQASLGRNLRIGQQVDAKIRVASKSNALLLPRHVLFSHKDSPHVAVVEKGKIVFIPVVTGIENMEQVEIVKGLHIGQKVIDPVGLRLEIGMNAVIN